jgi:hypothetical protein
MADISVYLANKLLAHVFQADIYVPPDYVATSLHTADPQGIGLFEVSGGGYARGGPSWDFDVDRWLKTGSIDTFGTMPACTVTHFGCWDSEFGGNFLWQITLPVPIDFLAGQDGRIEAGGTHVGIE